MNAYRIVTLALLVGAVALLQYHSIQFWAGAVSPVTGPAWSLLLEGSALWLWSDARGSRRALGGVATALLLAGPLYQVSAPLLQEGQQTELGAAARAERREALRAEVASLEGALAGYVGISSTRAGWAGRIDQTQARLDAARAELAELTRAGAEPVRLAWQRQAVIGMQAAALVLLQVVGVLCIGELRGGRLSALLRREPEGPSPRPSSTGPRPLRAVPV